MLWTIVYLNYDVPCVAFRQPAFYEVNYSLAQFSRAILGYN
jgi:hypothetical protein